MEAMQGISWKSAMLRHQFHGWQPQGPYSKLNKVFPQGTFYGLKNSAVTTVPAFFFRFILNEAIPFLRIQTKWSKGEEEDDLGVTLGWVNLNFSVVILKRLCEVSSFSAFWTSFRRNLPYFFEIIMLFEFYIRETFYSKKNIITCKFVC